MMGGYMQPGAMYGGYPPMYGMDPYAMMGGGGFYPGQKSGGFYKQKAFKNKTFVSDKVAKAKPKAANTGKHLPLSKFLTHFAL
jgi:hypothetical protein